MCVFASLIIPVLGRPARRDPGRVVGGSNWVVKLISFKRIPRRKRMGRVVEIKMSTHHIFLWYPEFWLNSRVPESGRKMLGGHWRRWPLELHITIHVTSNILGIPLILHFSNVFEFIHQIEEQNYMSTKPSITWKSLCHWSVKLPLQSWPRRKFSVFRSFSLCSPDWSASCRRRRWNSLAVWTVPNLRDEPALALHTNNWNTTLLERS